MVSPKKIMQREGGTIATETAKGKGNTLTAFVKTGNLPGVVEITLDKETAGCV